MTFDGTPLWQGRTWPWECDMNGHLSAMFYSTRLTEAMTCLAAQLGMPRAFAADAESTLVVREQHIRFHRETMAGVGLVYTGGVAEADDSGATLLFLAHQIETGVLSATFLVKVEHVTARAHRAFPWSDAMRARLDSLTLQPPPEARPRSIGAAPVDRDLASPEKVAALGMRTVGMSALRPADCDSFGRMLPDVFLKRLTANVVADKAMRPGKSPYGADRVGGAMLEFRLIFQRWPRAGDILALWAGGVGHPPDARFRKTVSWLMDPVTGQAWGVAAQVGCSLDLDTRKILTPSEEEMAAYNATTVAGLDF